jgi:hypothetical protein
MGIYYRYIIKLPSYNSLYIIRIISCVVDAKIIQKLSQLNITT